MSTWILLRGLTRETRHWGTFPDILRAALPDADIALIDLPGCGELHAQASPTTIEDIAAACRTEAGARQLAPPYHLLALSLGAMVAVAWADAHPEEIAACVLINTSFRSISPGRKRLRPAALGQLFRLATSADAATKEGLVLKLTSHRPEAHTDVVAGWMAYRRERPVSLANTLRQLIAASRYRAPAAAPVNRILVLAGTRDRLVDPDCSRRLASLWHADYAEHPDAGHDLPLDDGRWVAEQVSRWRHNSAIDSP